MLKVGCSYFGNYHLKHVKEDFKELQKIGFNTLTLTLSEHDYQFYRQTLGEIIELAKENKFEIYLDPWGVGKVFGGEPYSWFVAKYHSECQVLEDGTVVPHACPNSPAFREYMNEWITFACSTSTDYILWDEPHLYIPGWAGDTKGRWACHCIYCRKKFKTKYGKALPKILDEKIELWRESILIDFLSYLTTLTHQKGKKNNLILLPSLKEKQGQISWENIHTIPHVSIFGTDPYWQWDKQELKPYVSKFSNKVLKICKKNNWEGQIWIQGFKIPTGHEKEITQAFSVALESGIRNISIWAYDCCKQISWVRCDNSDLAWKMTCDTVRKLHEK